MTTPGIPDFFLLTAWNSSFCWNSRFFYSWAPRGCWNSRLFCRNCFGIPGFFFFFFFCQQPLEFQTFLSNLFWNSIFFVGKKITLYRGSDIIWNSPMQAEFVSDASNHPFGLKWLHVNMVNHRELPCFGLASILEVKQRRLQHGSDPNSLCSIQSGEWPRINNILYLEML